MKILDEIECGRDRTTVRYAGWSSVSQISSIRRRRVVNCNSRDSPYTRKTSHCMSDPARSGGLCGREEGAMSLGLEVLRQRVLDSGLDCELWPAATQAQYWWDQGIAVAQFPDIDGFHPALIERVLELESDQKLSYDFSGRVGGSKIFNLEQWDCPEADLIHYRALSMFCRITSSLTAVADSNWATTYRRGQYCMPHSHRRAVVSIVYLLNVGQCSKDTGGDFRLADPRVDLCCRETRGCVTSPWTPGSVDGTMILFPARTVHFVEPYWGDEPRISLAWNVNAKAIEEPDTVLQDAKQATRSASG